MAADGAEQERSELQRLREQNARLRRRVRTLQGRDSGDLGYLFVMTYGRSGSTLLMGLLNSLPGYLIRGENRDAVHHLFGYHRTLLTESTRYAKRSFRRSTNAFFGIGDFPPERSLADIRQLVLDTLLRPRADTRVTGFKEIRWYQPDLEEYVGWLGQVFPGARFLVNTRNHADVLASEWWAEDDNSGHLADIERRMLAVAESLGPAAYRVHYDDYVADPSALRGLFDWLGEAYDEERVRATMAVRHSI